MTKGFKLCDDSTSGFTGSSNYSNVLFHDFRFNCLCVFMMIDSLIIVQIAIGQKMQGNRQFVLNAIASMGFQNFSAALPIPVHWPFPIRFYPIFHLMAHF